MADRHCPQCDAQAEGGASFCPSCGGSLAAPVVEPPVQNQFAASPPPQKPPGWWKKRSMWQKLGIMVAALVVIAAAAGCGSDSEKQTTTTKAIAETTTTKAAGETTTTEGAVSESTTTAESSVEAGADSFSLGETAEMDGLQITVNSAHWDKGNDFTKPDAGTRWLVLDCTLKNNRTESESISSLLMFKLVDEDSYARDMEIFADTKGSLDGEIAAGASMRGQIAFDVDEGQAGWTFIFEPNVFGAGQLTYDVSSSDVK